MIPLDHECSDLSQQLLNFGIQRGRRSLVLPRQAGQHVGAEPSFSSWQSGSAGYRSGLVWWCRREIDN